MSVSKARARCQALAHPAPPARLPGLPAGSCTAQDTPAHVQRALGCQAGPHAGPLGRDPGLLVSLGLHGSRAWTPWAWALGAPRLRAAHPLCFPPLHTQLVCFELFPTSCCCLFHLLPASVPVLLCSPLCLYHLSVPPTLLPPPSPPSLSFSLYNLFFFPFPKENPPAVLPVAALGWPRPLPGHEAGPAHLTLWAGCSTAPLAGRPETWRLVEGREWG